MRKLLISILLISTSLFADSEPNIKELNKISSLKEICKDSKVFEIRQKGCCSWHGGISGCSNGRIVCNDGTYSPSCTCYSPVNPLG